MILFQLHCMWYETNMLNECFTSITEAKKLAPNVEVKVKICLNEQTYVETPEEGQDVRSFFSRHADHPLLQDSNTEIVVKTNDHPFYNIADWRREVYDPQAKYTVWGESDCLLPRDFFAILGQVEVPTKHILTFSSRPMWDNSWDIVTHKDLQGYSKPCQCPKDNHREDCIELLESPLKYKDYITQRELDEYNDKSGDIEIKQIPLKIDGSLVSISSGLQDKFLPENMHFVREDTCFEYYCRIKEIPQLHVTSRLKGHNYRHPKKRTGTFSTRDDKVFKKYADESVAAMNEFISKLSR